MEGLVHAMLAGVKMEKDSDEDWDTMIRGIHWIYNIDSELSFI